MSYKEILEKQKATLQDNIKWWPDFLYHFTDVHNASNILYEGFIWSRQKAEDKQVMKNDNASHAVIVATNHDSKCYGRLYFRPLTPTQYHNEGYKPEKTRDNVLNANCPVPVFLCLSASATLSLNGTLFAEKGLAGNRHNIRVGVDEFKKLNFKKIYHDGWYTSDDADIKEYRHSEVIHENGFPVEPLLRGILCRSEAERETLLFLLGQYSMRLYNTYKNKIIYNPKYRCFYNNGIFVKAVSVLDNKLRVEFNDPELRKRPQTSIDIDVQIDISYRRYDGTVLTATTGKGTLDYCSVRSCEMNFLYDIDADFVRIKILIDENVMYENEICMDKEMIF